MIAPSLAERGLVFCAWESYLCATSVLLRTGKKRAALDVYRDATVRMPGYYEGWTSKSALEQGMGRKGDAVQTLREALPNLTASDPPATPASAVE